VQHRAFVSNTYSGNLQIMDTQNDTTPLTAQSYNSSGQLVPGVPVTITVAGSLTFEVESPDRTTTLIYDQGSNALDFVDNATEVFSGSVTLPDFADMALFSTDGTKVYAPVRNAPITAAPPGAVEVATISSFTVTDYYAVPSARYIALSPSGQFLLVFADNSDSVFLIDLNATTPRAVEIPGFARPVNASWNACRANCSSKALRWDVSRKTMTAPGDDEAPTAGEAVMVTGKYDPSSRRKRVS